MSGLNGISPPDSNAASHASTLFLDRFDGLRERLPGDRDERVRARALLAAHGLPKVGDEAWRYTSLRALEGEDFIEALTPVGVDGQAPAMIEALGLPDLPRFVFVDGRYAPSLSRPPASAQRHGLRATRFADDPVFDGNARPDDERFVALNTMLAEDGLDLRVDPDADAGTVMLVSLGAHAGQRPIAFHPRHRISLAPGARLALIEVSAGEGTYLHNPVFEITVGRGAHLSHVRLQDEDEHAFHVSTTYVDAAENATYDGFSLNIGARLARTEIHARLAGAGGTVHLNAAQLLSGRQHADFTTVVSHDAPDTASRQTVRHVLGDDSRAVFQGRIEVARAAQKTDGYQMNQALLLSPNAEIDCKPELRIHADDVKCSHGATVGALDEDQLFYLRSRGIPSVEARRLLVRAFVDASIGLVEHEAARAVLERAVDTLWRRGQARERRT